MGEVGAVPILMVQIHCHEVKIAVLDRPHCVYYRVRVLENVTIPLTPLESLEALEAFVNHWLRLQAYLDGVANQIQNLRSENFIYKNCDRHVDDHHYIDNISNPALLYNNLCK